MNRCSETYFDTDDWQDHPSVVARPPLIAAGLLAVGFIVDVVLPAPFLHEAVQFLGGAGLLIAAVGLMASAVRAFREAGTPVEIWRPTARIVRDGPYAVTRNPVYVAMVLGYAGIGTLADAPAVLALAPVLFAVLHFGVVLREEDYLECKFGDGWLDYRAAVARWA